MNLLMGKTMFLIFEKSETGVRNAPKSKKITKSLKSSKKTKKCVVSGQIPLITTIIFCVKKLQKKIFKAILLYKQSHNNHHFYAIAFSNCVRRDPKLKNLKISSVRSQSLI